MPRFNQGFELSPAPSGLVYDLATCVLPGRRIHKRYLLTNRFSTGERGPVEFGTWGSIGLLSKEIVRIFLPNRVVAIVLAA